jgi:hypothetical protein
MRQLFLTICADFIHIVKVKQFLYGSWGFQEVEAPDFQTAQLIGRHQSQEPFLGLISVRGWVVHFLAFRRFVSRVSAMETKLVNIALTTRPTLPFLLFTGTVAVVNGWSCEVWHLTSWYPCGKLNMSVAWILIAVWTTNWVCGTNP